MTTCTLGAAGQQHETDPSGSLVHTVGGHASGNGLSTLTSAEGPLLMFFLRCRNIFPSMRERAGCCAWVC